MSLKMSVMARSIRVLSPFQAKDGVGAKAGILMNLELVNLPYRETFKDPRTDDFREARLVIEKAVSYFSDIN